MQQKIYEGLEYKHVEDKAFDFQELKPKAVCSRHDA